jgi:hypothetical protein
VSLDLKPGERAMVAVECDLESATGMVVSARCGDCGHRYELHFPIVNGVIVRRAEKLCEGCGGLVAFELRETRP